MRLTAFRIQGFRCYEDSGVCHVASDITILAGKNDCGKSAALDAFELFITNRPAKLNPLDPTLSPSESPAVAPSLWTEFELTDVEATQLAVDVGLPQIPGREVTALWSAGAPVWELGGEVVLGTKRSIEQVTADKHAAFLSQAHAALSERGIPLPETKEAGAILDLCRRSQVPDAALKGLQDVHAQITQLEAGLRKLLLHLFSLVPPFVVFRSFDDELPDFVNPLDSTAMQKQIVQDVFKLAGLDPRRLVDQQQGILARVNMVEEATSVCTSAFGRFWKQEQLLIGVTWSKDLLAFTIRGPDERKSYAPSQRSKGFRWYLSFFITLTARKDRAPVGVILIDEPGLYLHSKAQSDLLDLLDDMTAAGYQFILATHSPYLIRPDRLDRVRLVVKDDRTRRSRIRNSWYAGADRDTLTPIITALGLDVSRSMPGLPTRCIIVEGPSDYYYLQAMKVALETAGHTPLPADVGFVPCLGHANSGLLVSFLAFLGLECVVLLDKKGTGSTARRLIGQGFPPSKIIRAGREETESLADLLAPADAQRYLVAGEDQEGARVSVRVKRMPLASEALAARRFLDRVRTTRPEFSPETLRNFTELFARLASAFGQPPGVVADAAGEVATGRDNRERPSRP